MGFPKMLLPFNGMTMIGTVIRNVVNSEVENIMVVLGDKREEILKLIDVTSVNHCYNYNYKDGMLSSVKCGFRSLPETFEAVLIFQGDQPLITPAVINTVIDAYRSADKGIVIPVFDRKRGHPLLIDKKYRNDIEKLDTLEGLRALSYQFPDDVLEVKTNDPGILRDFDTFEEYKKEFNQML